MKTILVIISQAVGAKSILRTDIYPKLTTVPDVRVILAVPTEERRHYYECEFSGPRVEYAVYGRYRPRLLDRGFSQLKIYLLRTKTMDWKRRLRLAETGNYLRYGFSWLANRIVARSAMRRAVRRLDWHLVRNDDFKDLFERYRPDAVFFAHLFGDVEVAILREARRRRIPTVGLINSWDKLTSRCILRLLPDTLIVHNERIREEAIRHDDMPSGRIVVTGVPNYDYLRSYRPVDRRTFCRRIGADPAKRIILYCPAGQSFTPDGDRLMLNTLEEFLHSGAIPADAQILVRFQPNDQVSEELLRPRPGFVFDRPGVRFAMERGGDWDMTFDDLRHLADTLHHSAIVITHVSSIILEAAILDKPIITADLERELSWPLMKSLSWRFYTDHHEDILTSGGAWKTDSREDLAKAIRDYLKDPILHREGRRRIVASQCGTFDGKAGERIAQAILATVK